MEEKDYVSPKVSKLLREVGFGESEFYYIEGDFTMGEIGTQNQLCMTLKNGFVRNEIFTLQSKGTQADIIGNYVKQTMELPFVILTGVDQILKAVGTLLRRPSTMEYSRLSNI